MCMTKSSHWDDKALLYIHVKKERKTDTDSVKVINTLLVEEVWVVPESGWAVISGTVSAESSFFGEG